MSKKDLREKLFNIVKSGFREYTFDRMEQHMDNINYTYQDFIDFNKKHINELKVSDLKFYLRIYEERENIRLVDEDNFVEFSCDTIYFNEEKNFCIMNYR